MSGGWNDSLSKQRLPHHWLSPAWGLQVSWDAPHNFKDTFPLISTHRTLGINEKLFKKWQSYNVAWAHQEWHRFAFFHNISFTRVAHKHQTVTQENNHQVDTHIHDGLQEFTSTFQLFAVRNPPLLSVLFPAWRETTKTTLSKEVWLFNGENQKVRCSGTL